MEENVKEKAAADKLSFLNPMMTFIANAALASLFFIFLVILFLMNFWFVSPGSIFILVMTVMGAIAAAVLPLFMKKLVTIANYCVCTAAFVMAIITFSWGFWAWFWFLLIMIPWLAITVLKSGSYVGFKKQ